MTINKKIISILTVISLLYVLPIMLANVYFTDDMARIITGHTWNHDGRFFASYLSHLLSFNDKYITSLYPFSILVASLIMVITGYIVSNLLGLNNPSNITTYLIALSLLISPFYLENLAYRYDSLYMALSVFFAIFPLIFWKKKHFILISITSIFITLGLYQTSAMLFIAIMLCMEIQSLITKDKIHWKFVLINCIAFVITFLLYKVFTNLFYPNIGRASFLPLTMDSAKVIYNRVHDYKRLFSTLLIQSKYIYAILPLLLLSIAGFIYVVISKKLSTKLGLLVPLILGTFVTLFLPNILLVTMWLTARTLIVFPIFIIIMAILITPLLVRFKNRALKYVSNTAVIIVIIYSFTLSSIFGSILKNNDDFYTFLESQVWTTILNTNNESSQNSIHLIILGSAPVAPQNLGLYYRYPIMNTLAPNYLTTGWVWGIKAMSKNYYFSWPKNREALEQDICNQPIIQKSPWYYLRKSDNTYIIDFNKNC